jgi:hypothetical protein
METSRCEPRMNLLSHGTGSNRTLGGLPQQQALSIEDVCSVMFSVCGVATIPHASHVDPIRVATTIF